MKLSWLLPPFVLYICSPLLLSLTKATTSDTIWPLAGGLFMLASVLGGFGENVGFGRQDGRAEVARSVRARQTSARRTSFGELTLVDKSQR
jgi:phosphatidylinositol glycan class C protein